VGLGVLLFSLAWCDGDGKSVFAADNRSNGNCLQFIIIKKGLRSLLRHKFIVLQSSHKTGLAALFVSNIDNVLI
jgi:hypothetical protein